MPYNPSHHAFWLTFSVMLGNHYERALILFNTLHKVDCGGAFCSDMIEALKKNNVAERLTAIENSIAEAA